MFWKGLGLGLLLIAILIAILFGIIKMRTKQPQSELPCPQNGEELLDLIPIHEPSVLAPHVVKLWPGLDEQIRQQLKEKTSAYGWEAYFLTDLEDPEIDKRIHAIEILGLIGGRKSLWPLLGALGSRNANICFAATAALKELQAPGLIETLVESLGVPERWPPARVAEIIMAKGKDAVMPILDKLPTASTIAKGNMIELLGELGDVRAVPYLIEGVEDEDPGIRAKSASALAKINGPVMGVTDSLQQALKDEAWEVRAHAALAVGNLQIQEMAATLEELLSDPDWRVKETAQKALKQLN